MPTGADLNPVADLNLFLMTMLWNLVDGAYSMKWALVSAIVMSIYVFEERHECRGNLDVGPQADRAILLYIDAY